MADVVSVLTIAIVAYAPDLVLLATVLTHLDRALRHADQTGRLTAAHLILVDNGPGTAWREPLQHIVNNAALSARVELLSGHGNVGYGVGHNLALGHHHGDYHLILNPDVLLAEDALSAGLAFLAEHPEAGLITPAAWDRSTAGGSICASVIRRCWIWRCADLRLRFCGGVFNRLDRYELREADRRYAVLWDPPIVSGCFMLCRRAALNQVGGFAPEYFLYFEDFDLSLRLAAVTRLVYVPTVRDHSSRRPCRP
jgi:GT2 family glycosyltransferase